MKTKLNFSVLLIKSRRVKRLTQRQVAQAVGVSQSAYNYWESGKHYPNVQKIFSLTRVLSIPIEEMIGGWLLKSLDLNTKDFLFVCLICVPLNDDHLSEKFNKSYFRIWIAPKLWQYWEISTKKQLFCMVCFLKAAN